MPHSLVKNWLHIVFATKYRQPLITDVLEFKLYEKIKEETEGMGCHLSRINGMPDHVHLLILLHPSKSLADYVKQIKGASAYQVNQHNWIMEKFGWQKGYGAFSVSESQLRKIQTYIERQKIHHRQMDLDTEWGRFLELHNLDDNG
jgi:putative transposase